MRKIGEWLLAQDRNAALVAFLAALSPLLYLPGGLVAAIIVGLVTLHRGVRSGLIVLAWVALPAISLLFLHRVGVFDVLLVRCVLVWILASVLRSHRSWRLVLEVAVVIGVVGVIGVHLFVNDVSAWWLKILSDKMDVSTIAANWKVAENEITRYMQRIAPIATGLAGFVILFGTIVELLIARWWQAAMFNPGGLRKEFVNIHMSRAASIVVVLAMLGGLLHAAIIIDLFPLLLLPFMLAGLSLMHLMLGMKKGLLIPVILVYTGLVFATFYMVLLLALLGFVDSWWDFRKRIHA